MRWAADKTNKLWRAVLLGSGVSISGFSHFVRAQVEFHPRLNVESVFVSNIDYTPSNEDSDYVEVVTPGFAFSSRSGAVSTEVNYDLQNLQYFERSDLNRGYHNLDSAMHGDWLDGKLGLEGIADYRQQTIDFNGPITQGNIGDNRNLADQRVLGLVPTWREPLGTWAQAEFSYSLYDVTDLIDSRNAGVLFELKSGPRFSRIGWTLSYRGNRVYYDKFDDAKYRNTNLDLNYRLTHQYLLVGSIGVENNDYVQSPTAENPRGITWDIGGAWVPSDRTRFEARLGDRFFGRTYLLDMSYRRRRISLSANYDEQATSLAQQQIGNAQLDPGGLPSVVDAARDDTFIQKRGTVEAVYETDRNRLRLTLSDDDRQSETGLVDQAFTDYRVEWERSLTRRTTLTTTLTIADWTSARQQNDDFSGRVAIEHQLGRHLYFDLSAGQSLRETDVITSEYRVNTISVGIRMEL